MVGFVLKQLGDILVECTIIEVAIRSTSTARWGKAWSGLRWAEIGGSALRQAEAYLESRTGNCPTSDFGKAV
jgi:hypothetical protein